MTLAGDRATIRDGSCVLHVCDYAAPYPGAFIRQLSLLDEALAAGGFGRAALAFPARASATHWFGELERAGTAVHTLPTSSPRRPLRAALAVARTIERSGARIVHSHFGGYDIPTRLAISAGAHRDRVLIWHYRTALPEGVAGRGAARRIKDFAKYRVLAGRVDRCVAVTTATATEAALRGMGPRAVAIRSGCDTDTFRPDPAMRADARRRLGLADDDVVLLHFGWYPHRKGNDVLAEAVRLLNERGLGPLVALSVGAPSAAPPLRTLPFTDHVLELHQAADIFVSASRSEAFGNGVVEALACGNVAVATLASGQREIFEGLEGCWTARPGDTESLASGIAACLERRDDWPRLGAANRRHVVDNYGMRSWAARMVRTYADLCDSHGRACA